MCEPICHEREGWHVFRRSDDNREHLFRGRKLALYSIMIASPPFVDALPGTLKRTVIRRNTTIVRIPLPK